MTDLIGWVSTAVLLATVGRQAYDQWKQGSTAGLSRWLFVGQLAASTGFVIYSWLLGNWVFVVSNVFLLIIAAAGQVLYLRNRKRESDGARDDGRPVPPGPSDDGSAVAPSPASAAGR